jgi:hypothetical protein
VVSFRVPVPCRGVTVRARVATFPVSTLADPVPCPMTVPAAFLAFAVTAHEPNVSPLIVVLELVVDWLKVPPPGPEPLMS